MGFDTADMSINLENSARFVINGGPGLITSPTSAANSIVTCDGVQTLTNKTINGLSAYDQYFSARSTAIGTQTISSLAAGRYAINISIETTTSGTGNTAFTFAWVSAGVTRTIISGGFSFTAPMLTSEYSVSYVVNVDAGSNLTFATSYASTGAYAFSFTLTKL